MSHADSSDKLADIRHRISLASSGSIGNPKVKKIGEVSSILKSLETEPALLAQCILDVDKLVDELEDEKLQTRFAALLERPKFIEAVRELTDLAIDPLSSEVKELFYLRPKTMSKIWDGLDKITAKDENIRYVDLLMEKINQVNKGGNKDQKAHFANVAFFMHDWFVIPPREKSAQGLAFQDLWNTIVKAAKARKMSFSPLPLFRSRGESKSSASVKVGQEGGPTQPETPSKQQPSPKKSPDV